MAAFLTIIVLCLFRFQDSIDMTDSASHSPPEAHSGDTLDDAVSRLSNIMQEDNDFSTNRASAVYQLSTVRENEAPKASPAAQSFGGAPQRNFSGGGHTTNKPDDESCSTIWLRAMGVNEDAASFGHMRRFLDTIGVSDIEDIQALATSFDGIVQMIGSQHNPVTLMKLRNALWHSTDLPHAMKREVSIVDMMRLIDAQIISKTENPLWMFGNRP
jgi:hypothetical protein